MRKRNKNLKCKQSALERQTQTQTLVKEKGEKEEKEEKKKTSKREKRRCIKIASLVIDPKIVLNGNGSAAATKMIRCVFFCST